MTEYDETKSLEERDSWLRYRKDRLTTAINKLDNVIEKAERDIEQAWGKVRTQSETVADCFDALEREIPLAVGRDIKRLQALHNKLLWENKQLKKEIANAPSRPLTPEVDPNLVKKASTICVFDSLIFSIENWSSDGQVASDVSLCTQSILFPLVYEPVMRGDSDYYLESFPTASMEIVRRGREFVKWLRDTSPTSLSDQDTWEAYSGVVQEWWVNDALPLLYGARSDEWVISSSYDFDTMLKWRDLPASRILDFPLIHDGMELVSNQMDNIRQPLGLQNFMQAQIQTRIEL